VFLDIDQFHVGALLSSGQYEVFQTGNHYSGTLPAANAAHRKIGTDTMTLCSSVFLVGPTGTIAVHLQPQACELLLAVKGKLSSDQKKNLQQQLGDQYKRWKDIVVRFEANCKTILRNFEGRLGAYTTYIVMGPNANNAQLAGAMVTDLFGKELRSIVGKQLPNMITPTATSRFAWTDYTVNPAVFHIGDAEQFRT
jgi:hypothetical protein